MNGDVSSLELNFFATAFRELILSPVVLASQLLGIGLTNGLVSAGGLTYPPPESGTESVTFFRRPINLRRIWDISFRTILYNSSKRNFNR